MDVDLGRSDDEKVTTEDFIKAQAADLGDYFVFIIEHTARLDELREGTAVRYHVESDAGRRFEAVSVDVAFNDSIAEHETLPGLDPLAFAGIDPIEVPATRLTQHIAEKLHAYARMCGAQGRQSTRVKDLVDIVLIANAAHVDATELRLALKRTSTGRGGHSMASEFPPPPAAWRVPYRRYAGELSIPAQLEAAHAAAADFLNPILSGDLAVRVWEPASQSWQSGG